MQIAGINLPLPAAQGSQPVEPAPPPLQACLELHVTLSADRRTLSYTLVQPETGPTPVPLGSVELRTDPSVVLQPAFDHIAELTRRTGTNRTPAETEQATRWLASFGAQLYEQFLPDEFKRVYPELRNQHRGEPLLVISEEPWIPWEMVRPVEYDSADNAAYDDPPLCETFQLARWLAGPPVPAQISVALVSVVAPPANLMAMQQEVDYWMEVHRQQGDMQVTGPVSQSADFLGIYRESRADLVHIVCHGNFNTDNPEESKIKLADNLRATEPDHGPRTGRTAPCAARGLQQHSLFRPPRLHLDPVERLARALPASRRAGVHRPSI